MSSLTFHLLRSEDYTVQAWKNGGGATAQIAIHPGNAQFPDDAFDWRISSARIAEDGAFSRFPGLRRILVVLSGPGVWLNDQRLSALEPFSFSGDEGIACRRAGDVIEDLGVIYRPERVRASMTILDEKVPALLRRDLSPGIHFIFAAHGRLDVGGNRLETRDCLRIEGHGEITVVSGDVSPEFNAVLISLESR